MNLNEYVQELNESRIKTHRDALKHFQVRYASFKPSYPKEARIPASSLANFGFYFEENKKRVKCVECDFGYDDFNEDLITDILHKHLRHSPDCPDKNKMALPQSTARPRSKAQAKRPKTNNLFAQEDSRIKSFEGLKILLSTKKLTENGFYRVSKEGQVMSPSLKTKGRAVEDEEEGPTSIESLSYLLPSQSLIHIRCAFCAFECLIYKNSLLNTLYKCPFDEHWLHSRNTCPVFKDQEPSKARSANIDWLQTLFDMEQSDEGANSKAVSECRLEDDMVVSKMPRVIVQILQIEKIRTESSAQVTNSENLFYAPHSDDPQATNDFNRLQNVLYISENVINEKAYHPAYALHETRLESFREWPATLSQQPADLAKAGFYYFGIKDMVKCFFCNGGLKNWDQKDDPFEDHVRWFPKCQFIKQIVGAEYVEKTKDKYKNLDSGFKEELKVRNAETLSAGSKSLSSNNNKQSTPIISGVKKRAVSPRTLNSRLDLNIVRRVLDANIMSKESIKQSIESKLSIETSKGALYADDFRSAVEMALVAFDLERAKQQKTSSLKTLSDLIIPNIGAHFNADVIYSILSLRYGVHAECVR